MPPIRSLIFKYLAHHSKLIAVILLFSEIMPSCSYYTEKGLVYIIIIALSSRQLFFYSECIKLNIRLSCNIYSISNAECIYFTICLYTL
jgi:hypothetical protein